jgi:serine/threonine-protein kinase
MPLEPGTSFGAYEIVAAIGAGGMGTVFRARDTRLGRDVALKLLPESFAQDPDRVARFRREAQVLAALNHPNIGAIYGLEEFRGAQAIVLELVDGETLAARLTRGPVPLSDQIEIGRQIADALDAAHDRGIVHRDLKPSNVMLRPDGVVKVVDLGLATPVDAARRDTEVLPTPTITSPPGTAAGVVLGTAPYMSPEQARGRPVDRRTDVWALGCILYELATGQPAFGGDSTTDTMAAILTREPDWSRLPAGVPPALRSLIGRCLRKESRQRVQSAGDVRVALEECERVPLAQSPSVPAGRVRPLSLVLAGAAGVLVGGAAWALFMPAPNGATETALPPVRAVLQLPADAPLWLDDGESVAFSRDGRLLAWVGGVGPARRIFTRPIDGIEAVPVAGTEGATNPFFSPDGHWIGFFTIGALKKIPIAGGSPTMLAAAGETTRGGTWGDDNTIVFAPSVDSPLRRVPAAGGMPTDATKLSVLGANSHRFPTWVPGRQALLYTLRLQASTSGTRDLAIAAIDLATGAESIVIPGATHPVFLATGELLFLRNETLFLVPFDASRLRTSGAEQPVVAGVHVDSSHAGQFAAGGTRLVYVTGGTSDRDVRSMVVWRGLAGDERVLMAEPGSYRDLRFSPDGRRLAYADFPAGSLGSGTDLWVSDLQRDVKVRLASAASGEWRPVWTADGRDIIYADTAGGILRVRADGSGAPVKLTTTTASQVPVSISPDGKYLAYHEDRDFTADIWILPLDPAGPPRKFFEGPAAETLPVFSPDGQWIAYTSNESGSPQLYVRPFPTADAKWQVSSTGTLDEHAWSPDGTKLYFRRGDGSSLMVAPISSRTTQLEVGRATPLFDLSAEDYPEVAFWGGLSLSPDGRGFAMVKNLPRAQRDRPRLVLLADWLGAARRGTMLVSR